MDFKIDKVEDHSDERGNLVILLKKSELSRKFRQFGEVFYITFAKKGVVRGNHYHKNWREWFIVVSGKLQVELEDTKTKKHVTKILNAKSKTLERLEVGPYVAHCFKSLTSGTCLLNYSNTQWNQKDVIPYVLIPAKKMNVA